jgi:hypothetical protein
MNNPMKRWKLSPMDLQSITRWEDYSRRRTRSFAHTDTATSPVDGRWSPRRSAAARLNMIAHLLASSAWKPVYKEELVLPERRVARLPTAAARRFHEVTNHAATLE